MSNVVRARAKRLLADLRQQEHQRINERGAGEQVPREYVVAVLRQDLDVDVRVGR